MSIIEINSQFRKYAFIALGFLIPLTVAGISILMVLIFCSSILDKTVYSRLKEILSNRVFVSILLFFLLHLAGLFWLDVTPVNGFKSWMVFIIPLLALSVDTNTARKGIYAFIVGMMIAEIGVYYNIFITWEQYLDGIYGSHLYLSGSRISYNPKLAIAIALILVTLLGGKYKGLRQTVTVLFLISMIVNMFMTGGRSGQVGFIMVWLVLSFYYLKNNTQGLYGMLIALVLILFIAFNYSPIFQKRAINAVSEFNSFQTTSASTNDCIKLSDECRAISGSVQRRLHYNQHSLNLFKASPWIGYGTGSLENIWSNYVDNSKIFIFKTTNPHSHHALILVQFGLIGFFIYLNIFYQQMKAAKLMPKNYEFKPIAILLPVFYVLINFYESYLWTHHTQALFAFLVSIIYRTDMYEKGPILDQ